MELRIVCPDEKLLPAYYSDKACAIDLKSSGEFIIGLDNEKKDVFMDKIVLEPSERILAKTGLSIALPHGCWGNIRARSGLAMKEGIIIMAGVIDEDYRGEIGVVIYNSSKKPFEINKYDRIAQMIIQHYEQPNLIRIDSLEETFRGSGGFGSTGKQ